MISIKQVFTMFQACRGENTDKGVHMKAKRPKGLSVQTDCLGRADDYAIPLHADMLIMWASYQGEDETPLHLEIINNICF